MVHEYRNARGPAAKDNIERRLREAVEVLKSHSKWSSLAIDACSVKKGIMFS